MSMKEYCVINKPKVNKKDLVYYRVHYALALNETESLLEKTKDNWVDTEPLYKKISSLQKKALSKV